ncbi:MAG: hypothetical protein Q7U16_06935 [Agitococcus sp.]|nr:hypothetical protein [Agitococcus sp.]
MTTFFMKNRVGNLLLATVLLATNALATSAYAGDLNCDDTSGLRAVGCYSFIGTIFAVGAGVVAVSTISDAMSFAHTLDARVNDDPIIFTVKLKGLNHSNYSYKPRGRENPLRLKCARVVPPKDSLAVTEYTYGRCEELRPSLDKSAPNYWNEIGYKPMVRFGFSKEGRINPSEAEVGMVLDVAKLPVEPW